MSKKNKILLIALDIVLVFALVLGVLLYQAKTREAEQLSIGTAELSRRHVKSLAYQGRKFPLKRHMTSLLLIGTDNFIDDVKQNSFEAFYNDNLADFLVVLVFDHNQKTVTPFQICRDTMCDVPWLSVNGMVGGEVFEQITLAHSFGSGKEDSCVNTRNAVSSLLHEAPIDYYLSFTMETVPLLNDLVGGVTIRLEDDIPALGPEYVKGAAVTLRGGSALRFVRYRDTALLDSNLQRMDNHRLYLESFTEAARQALLSDPDFTTRAFRAAEKYLCTDLSVENIHTIVESLGAYEILPVVRPEGEYRMGEEFAEYYVDDSSLWDCVRTAFCS